MQSKEYKWLHQVAYWITIVYLIFYVVFIVVSVLPIPLAYICAKHLSRANKLYHNDSHDCLIEDAKAVTWGFAAMYISVPIMLAEILVIIFIAGGA